MDIEQAYNIGPIVGAALRNVGINTVEELQKVGWQEAYIKLTESYPKYIHTMCAMALIGAVENQNAKNLTAVQKKQAKSLTLELKRALL